MMGWVTRWGVRRVVCAVVAGCLTAGLTTVGVLAWAQIERWWTGLWTGLAAWWAGVQEWLSQPLDMSHVMAGAGVLLVPVIVGLGILILTDN